MHRTFIGILIFVAIASALIGCNTAQECNAGPCLAATATVSQNATATAIPPTATAIPPTATTTPTATDTPTLTPTSTPINRDGLWDGSTSDGALLGAFQFIIENNTVTDIMFSYTLRNGGCTYMSYLGGTADKSSVQDNTVHATMFVQGGNVLTFDGVFDSDKKARGTLTYKGTLEGCGAFDKSANWSADQKPIPPTATATPIPPTETPTRKPTATKTPPPTFFEMPQTPVIPPQPTVIPTLDTRNVPAEIKPLVQAINKTRGATTFRLEQELVAQDLGAPANATTDTFSFRQWDEILGADRHTRITGALAETYGADPEKGFEYIIVNGVAYVHGPARMFGATQEKWYKLPAIPRGMLDANPLGLLDAPFQVGTNWNAFEHTGKPVSLDGQMCEVYVAGKNVFTQLLSALAQGQNNVVMDDAKVEAYVCADGFLHKLQINLTLRDETKRDEKITLAYTFHLYDANNISIQAPRETDSFTPTPQITVNEKYETEFPLPADVRNFSKLGTYEGQINYQTALSVNELVEFYRRALAEQSVREDTRMTTIDERGFSLVFTGWKPNKWLVIQSVDLGDLRNVNLRLEDAR